MSISPMLNLGGRRFIQSTSLSTHWKRYLSVTSTLGNLTLPSSSRQWKVLRTEILHRNGRTCLSCGYLSPHPDGRHMIIDHINGDLSNNDLSNLRVNCPPCKAIRRCGFGKLLTVSESTMEQDEIVRKTREMFENTGVIPHPERIDPFLKPVDIDVLELANMMKSTPWEHLPEEYRRLRGFFTEKSSKLFQDTMLTGDPDTKKPTKALSNKLDRKVPGPGAGFSGSSISYSEELHKSSQVFLDSYLPSKTLNTQFAWIRVYNPLSAKSDEIPDRALSPAWNKICAEGRSTLSEVDKLAEQFNFFSGSWLVFTSRDNVDDRWGRILKSTLAGTMGNSARVSTHNEKYPLRHLVCISNADYRSMAEVNRIRDELLRLGVKKRIPYKPDIYAFCGIHKGNSWGISPTLYLS